MFSLAVLTSVGLGVIAWRGWRARPAVAQAMSEGLGAGWRNELHPQLAARLLHHLPWLQILFLPILFRRHDVERLRNIPYGDAGRWNLLDLYRPRFRPPSGPTLVCLHGGGFSSGRKSREVRPLIYRLASQGWVCISANHRLRPAATFPDHLIDLKKVLTWVREHGLDYGADPTVIFAAGSSSGGNLALLAALIPNEPAFQPGFERADTSIVAAISLYGYYGPYYDRELEARLPSSPMAYDAAVAPPIFLAHGDHDTTCRCRVPDSWRSGSAAGQPSQWCTPDYLADSTRSICTIPSASRRSSTASRPSRLGSSRDPMWQVPNRTVGRRPRISRFTSRYFLTHRVICNYRDV
ncbi:MAG TPA: alpha/beta hydrolase, partial [Propionibacteriaceae bacterium]